MSQFEVVNELREEIPIFQVKGYYEKPTGKKVNEEAKKYFQCGRIFLILDLSKCEILSSPGVSTIVELAVDAADNYNGKLIICGLDKLKEKILTLVAIQSIAQVVPSLPEAIQAIRLIQGK